MTSIGRARALLAVALVSLVAIGVAWAGRIAEGRRALAEADSALERGDVTEAILAARIAGEARCPGCTAPDEGFARLEKIARDAEARGDDATAFAAWRATRAALLATAVASTTSTRRAHADAEIARFAHRIDAAAVAAGATPTPAAAEDRVRAALNESDVPGAATFALIGLGGIVFLAAGARFATSKTKRSVTELGLALAGAAVAAAGALLF
ncbi:MAG: hypothetical protein JWO86_4322 [Myxococcaceae bacterium]|nr:hypothetical protein [Myxococcaceae bacterium]